MAVLRDSRREAFAQALAAGASATQAARLAGYGSPGARPAERAARPDIAARVAEIEIHQRWGGSPDLAPLIDDLMVAAQEARALATPASLAAMRALVAEAAGLKGLPTPGAGAGDAPAAFERPVPEMDDAAWSALFGPDAAEAPATEPSES